MNVRRTARKVTAGENGKKSGWETSLMADVMRYESTVLFKGNSVRALDAAAMVLTSAGFKLVRKTTSVAELTAEPKTEFHQNPLVGASRVTLTTAGGRLSAVAELGGVANMVRQLRILPTVGILGMGIVMGVVVVFVLRDQRPIMWAVPGVFVGADLVFLLVFVPLIARLFESRTRSALDTLVSNAALMADA